VGKGKRGVSVVGCRCGRVVPRAQAKASTLVASPSAPVVAQQRQAKAGKQAVMVEGGRRAVKFGAARAGQ